MVLLFSNRNIPHYWLLVNGQWIDLRLLRLARDWSGSNWILR